MAQTMSAGSGGGDTTLTKVFVGGLAWETHKEGVRSYFGRFGEILEAVVIMDKSTGRSKGYGFVTFREADAAMRACVDPYPVIDGRRANCNLAYLGVQRSKPQLSPYLQPYAAVGHVVHGGSNMNTRAMKAAAIAGGAGFVDHGIQQGGIPQQGIPAAAYNVYGYSPYFSEYSYQPMTYYQAYGGLPGGAAQYQVYNGNGGTPATVPAAGLTMADPAGFYNPYYQYSPVSATSPYNNMMQYPQMYQYAAVGAPPDSSPTTVSSLHQFVGAVAFEPSNGGQAAGMTMSLAAPTLSAPPTPQYQYKLVSSKPTAAPDQKKSLA